MNKISIRFFDDREVRAIWDEDNSKWWYSVLDITGVLNVQYALYEEQELLEISEEQTEKRRH